MSRVDLVITTGESAGIGPEVSAQAALAFLQEQADAHITLIGDPTLFSEGVRHPRLQIESVKLNKPAVSGLLDVNNAAYVLATLDAAIAGCQAGRFQAMVTAPVHKGIINQSGIAFTGHTEYLAAACGVERVVMMLCANLPAGLMGLQHGLPLRVALATIHMPLALVSAQITVKTVLETIEILHAGLKSQFGIAQPRILVAGLNPHAGEGGYLGSEESTAIEPAIAQAQQAGIRVEGPFPGDTLFDLRSLDRVDVYLAMYHDQGLAPFKFVAFNSGVNVTLGLPIIRTSVDHGTALDIAGKDVADAGSMLEAIRLAFQLARHRKTSIANASGA
jgi:4-hydroxythreonine-4-phosphate dehydrogenase